MHVILEVWDDELEVGCHGIERSEVLDVRAARGRATDVGEADGWLVFARIRSGTVPTPTGRLTGKTRAGDVLGVHLPRESRRFQLVCEVSSAEIDRLVAGHAMQIAGKKSDVVRLRGMHEGAIVQRRSELLHEPVEIRGLCIPGDLSVRSVLHHNQPGVRTRLPGSGRERNAGDRGAGCAAPLQPDSRYQDDGRATPRGCAPTTGHPALRKSARSHAGRGLGAEGSPAAAASSSHTTCRPWTRAAGSGLRPPRIWRTALALFAPVARKTTSRAALITG